MIVADDRMAPVRSGWAVQVADRIWNGVVDADAAWNPEKTCYQLHAEYRKSGRSADACVERFIRWQTARAAGSGLLFGLPGIAFGAVTIPAGLTVETYLQMRMVAVIALLYGWDPRAERLRTLALLSMIGTGAATRAVRSAGVAVDAPLTANLIVGAPDTVFAAIGRRAGARFSAKAGTNGMLNLTKLVPVVGGLIGGGLSAVSTRRVGTTARALLSDGPVAGIRGGAGAAPAPAAAPSA